jgi:hypothetical protein
MNLDNPYPSIEVFLSSEHAVKRTEYADDCTWHIRHITAPTGWAIYMRLISFIMPNSMYAVNIYNNTILINEAECTVTPGNYSIKQLIAVLNTFVDGIVFTFDSITYKAKMTSATLTTLEGPLLVLLGILPATGTVLESKHIVDMTGNQTINVETDFTSIFPNLDARDFGSPALLARVGVTQPFGGIVNWQNVNTRDGLLLSSPIVTSIHLVLTQEDRLPLLATLDYDAVIQLRFVRTIDTRLRLT